MDDYYVNNNAQANGDHEVHKAGCVYLPTDRQYLGKFADCWAAVRKAKEIYRQSNGCYWCSRTCHTS